MITDVISMQRIVDVGVNIPNFAYPANINAPRPAGEYATVKLIEERPSGYPEKSIFTSPDGDMFFRTTALKVLAFDVMFSRNDVEASELASCFFRQDVQEVCAKEGMAVMSCSLIENDVVLLETNWEVRTGLRIVVNVLRVQDTAAINIEKAEVAGSLDAGKPKP